MGLRCHLNKQNSSRLVKVKNTNLSKLNNVTLQMEKEFPKFTIE